MANHDAPYPWGTINLNDPHCQAFVEAIASILTHLAEQEPAPASEQERIASYLARLFAPALDRGDRAPHRGDREPPH
jgi:hypothetical protein